MTRSYPIRLSTCLIALTLTLASRSQASEPSHEPTAKETAHALALNHRFIEKGGLRTNSSVHPIYDNSDFKYLLINSEHPFDDITIKEALARNLPDGVKLVVLTPTGNEPAVKSQYSEWIPSGRLIIASDDDAQDGFWARDAFPIPVASVADGSISLVNAKYYRNFTGGPSVTKAVGAKAVTPDYVFVGGNLLADPDSGRCFVVDSYRLFDVTDELLKAYYGCGTVHHLKHYAGIGDADEVIKPLTGKRILTSVVEYKADFEAMGYQVILLPDAGGFRTYVNSVIIGSTVFMPVFGQATDESAAAVYRGLGYKVVPINTARLSDEQHGSLHCLTMAYPAIGRHGSDEEFVRALGSRIYRK